MSYDVSLMTNIILLLIFAALAIVAIVRSGARKPKW
jgi:hypothetical protein